MVGILLYSILPGPVAMTSAKVSLAGVDFRKIMMIAVTLAVLTASLYVVLSRKYDEGTQKWAFGSIGAVLGFWLKQD